MFEEVSREMPNKRDFAPDLELAEKGWSFSQQFMLHLVHSTTILLFSNSYKHQLFDTSGLLDTVCEFHATEVVYHS
jgi:hypothetical protein